MALTLWSRTMTFGAACFAAMYVFSSIVVAAEVAIPPRPPRPVDYDPTPLPKIELSAKHPRIWFSAADVPAMRERCRGPQAAVLERAKRQAEDLQQSDLSRAVGLAFLYQMTGEAAYARKAIAVAQGRKAFDWVTNFNAGYPYSGSWGMTDPLACVFDWCYDQLSGEDRQIIGGELRKELAHGPYRARFHEPEYMNVWLSEILALYGAGIDDALASEHLASYNRAIHQFAFMADAIHADGAMGDYQFQYLYFMLFPELWYRATGDNLFNTCGFYHNQPMYLMYSLLPDHGLLPNDGDGGFAGPGAEPWENRLSASEAYLFAWRNNNPHARWLAREAVKWPRGRPWQPWQQLAWSGDSGPEKPLSELPPVKLFPSNQIAIMRSGWNLNADSTDTVAAFYCRPMEGHTHYDAGHFTIYRGPDRMVQDAGFYCITTEAYYHRNFYTRTVAHNCVLIDDPNEELVHPDSQFMTALDGGQMAGDVAHYDQARRAGAGYGYRGEIGNFIDDPHYTYLFADLTPAYNARKAVRVTRSFLFLKPSTFLVADWVTSVNPQTPKRWLLQLPGQPALEGAEKVVAGESEAGIIESFDARRATITCGKSKLTLQTLAPQQAVLRRIGGPGYSAWSAGKNWEPPPYPAGYSAAGREEKQKKAEKASHCWRIEVQPAAEGATAVFLNVLDIAAADTVAPPRAAPLNRGEAIGCTLQRAGTSIEILFSPDGRAQVDGQEIGRSVPSLKPF
jgi:hypothetical protein